MDSFANSTAVHPLTKNPLMCLGVTTIRRDGHQYLKAALGTLLDSLEGHQREQIHLIVFIAQTDPKTHPDYTAGWLQASADKILKYDVSDTVELARIRHLEEEHLFWNKSGHDYAYLLQSCAATGAPWVAIVEDDIVAQKGWYARAMGALEKLPKDELRWIYMKMFYTEKLHDWNSESWLLYLLTCLVVSLFSLIVLLACHARVRNFRKYVHKPADILALCLFWVPAFITLYFMTGKHSMKPYYGGLHRMQHSGCCTQGLIFPRKMVPRAIYAINTATDPRYYVDMTLKNWADREGLARYALTPPLLQHIGGRSSKGLKYDEGAASIWSFAFEDYT
ncbi:MAG: hypothetical protein LQ342_007891 [Letrouitia transgressa]|nr:MAG: hypothetical protein LQ342_007891 [Letrouitia transgressa]